jgi:hypothetical protein
MKTASVIIIAVLAATVLTGCVTVGYDMIKQQATVSFIGQK